MSKVDASNIPVIEAFRSNRTLTGSPPVEVIVVLGDVGEDAQPVRDLQRHHVLCVQQSRDPQFLLCHLESLGHKNNTNTTAGWTGDMSVPRCSAIQLL